MRLDLTRWGPATVLVVLVVIIVVAAGAVVTITDPATLTFRDYLTLLVGAAGSAGLLGVGRGILAGQEKRAAAPVAVPHVTLNYPSASLGEPMQLATGGDGEAERKTPFTDTASGQDHDDSRDLPDELEDADELAPEAEGIETADAASAAATDVGDGAAATAHFGGRS